VPEQDEERQVIATISQRLTDAFTRTVGEEMARASKKGVPTVKGHPWRATQGHPW